LLAQALEIEISGFLSQSADLSDDEGRKSCSKRYRLITMKKTMSASLRYADDKENSYFRLIPRCKQRGIQI
jgi:hypothetical protein